VIKGGTGDELVLGVRGWTGSQPVLERVTKLDRCVGLILGSCSGLWTGICVGTVFAGIDFGIVGIPKSNPSGLGSIDAKGKELIE